MYCCDNVRLQYCTVRHQGLSQTNMTTLQTFKLFSLNST
jgi:hypothetical protein